jgi:hypothetical protein
MHSVSGNLASMANGLPYAIAAQIAYPDRQCIAFVGDGGFAMLMSEFATCVKYNLPVKVVVIKNNTLGQIKWEHMVFLGNPEYGCELHPIDFAAFARACGGTGFTIEDPTACGAVLAEALSTPGPVVVEAIVDPFEPPMPPRLTLEQAAKFARSLARGEPIGVIILAPFAGKLIGSGLVGYLTLGLSLRQATAVGFGMSGRGAVELIIADIALRAGLFTGPQPVPPIIANLFSVVILMAVITTLVAPIILKKTLT